MLTLTRKYYEGISGGRVVYLLDIDIGGGVHHKALFGCVDSDSDLYGTLTVVTNVSPVAPEYHPVTREADRGECWVDVSRNWIKPILLGTRLKGQKVTVTQGWANCDEADFIIHFRGIIEDTPPLGERVVHIAIADPFAILDTTNTTSDTAWIGYHPLQVIYDGAGKGLTEKSGSVAAQINVNTFDPEQAIYNTSISHFNTSGFSPGTHAKKNVKTKIVRNSKPEPGIGPVTYKFHEKDVVSYEPYEHAPINALDAINDLVRLMYGMLRIDSDGKIEFKRFNSAATTDDDWTDDDIIPGSFRQESMDGIVINRISCNYGDGKVCRFEETNSQAAYAQTGSTERIYNYDLQTNWIEQNGHSDTPSLDAADTEMLLYGGIHGFCGNRWAGFPAGGQHASSPLSAARPGYYRMENNAMNEDATAENNVLRAEIAKFTANNYPQVVEGQLKLFDPDDGSISTVKYPHSFRVSGGTRGHFGTTSIADAMEGIYLDVTDVTMLAYCSQQILNRTRYGMAIIEVATPATKMALQEGDFVSWTTSRYLAYGQDGLTSSDKWEIIKKEPIFIESTPMIKWKLAAVSTGTATPTVVSISRGQRVDNQRALNFMMRQEDTFQGFVNGLEVTDVAGLSGSISLGIATAHTGRAYLPTATAYTFQASRDTYVKYDIETQALVFNPVALAGAAPLRHINEVSLGMVKTAAADITSVTDLRDLRAIDANKIILETITQAEVGDNELGSIKQKTAEIRAINANGSFDQWTKG